MLTVRWDDVCTNQALGGSKCNIFTPSLDALAAKGVRLMRHYTEPWCLPSRSALLTGLAPARLGVNFVNLVRKTSSSQRIEVLVLLSYVVL